MPFQPDSISGGGKLEDGRVVPLVFSQNLSNLSEENGKTKEKYNGNFGKRKKKVL